MSNRPSSTPSNTTKNHIIVTDSEPSSLIISSTPTHSSPPGTLYLNIHSIQLDSTLVSCTSPCIRVAIGDQKFRTVIQDIPSPLLSGPNLPPSNAHLSKWVCNHPFSLNLNYHLQLFSSIQIDILNANVIVPDSLLGRSEIRISKFCNTFPPPPPPPTPAVTKLFVPIFMPRHAPSRRPHFHLHTCDDILSYQSACQIGVLELSILYYPILIEQEKHDNTVSLLLNPEEVNGITTALLETILSALALSRHTRQTLRQVFKLLSVLRQGVEFVSTLEWVLGILLVLEYDELDMEPSPRNKIIVNRSLFASLLHYKKYSIAAYGWMGLVFFGKSNIVGDRRSMSAALPHVHPDDWLVRETATNNVFQPSYYVLIDRSQNALVICVRGTMSSVDAITDLVCEYSRYNDGLVHRGMKVAADWIAATVIPNIPDWITSHQIKKIVLVGHSLGGGTASILSMIIHDTIFPGLRNLVSDLALFCYAFGPPPVCSKNLSIRFQKIITTIVNEHDVVCRLSYGSILDLRTRLLAAVGGGGDNSELASAGQHGSQILKSLSRSSKRRIADPKLKSHFERISRTRQHLKTTNENPKLYLAGTIYHVRYDNPATTPPHSPLTPAVIPIDIPVSPSNNAPRPPVSGSSSSTGFLSNKWFKSVLKLNNTNNPPSETKNPTKLKLYWPSLVHEYIKYNKTITQSHSDDLGIQNCDRSIDNDDDKIDAGHSSSLSNLLVEVGGTSSDISIESPTRSIEMDLCNDHLDPPHVQVTESSFAMDDPQITSPDSCVEQSSALPPSRFHPPATTPETTTLVSTPIPYTTISPSPSQPIPQETSPPRPCSPVPQQSPVTYSPFSLGIRSMGLNTVSPPAPHMTRSAGSSPTSRTRSSQRATQEEVVIIEQVDCDDLLELKIRRNMFVQHLPDAYERALSRWLSGDADELGLDN